MVDLVYHPLVNYFLLTVKVLQTNVIYFLQNSFDCQFFRIKSIEIIFELFRSDRRLMLDNKLFRKWDFYSLSRLQMHTIDSFFHQVLTYSQFFNVIGIKYLLCFQIFRQSRSC